MVDHDCVCLYADAVLNGEKITISFAAKCFLYHRLLEKTGSGNGMRRALDSALQAFIDRGLKNGFERHMQNYVVADLLPKQWMADYRMFDIERQPIVDIDLCGKTVEIESAYLMAAQKYSQWEEPEKIISMIVKDGMATDFLAYVHDSTEFMQIYIHSFFESTKTPLSPELESILI